MIILVASLTGKLKRKHNSHKEFPSKSNDLFPMLYISIPPEKIRKTKFSEVFKCGIVTGTNGLRAAAFKPLLTLNRTLYRWINIHFSNVL